MAKSLVAELCFQQKCPRFNPLSPIVTIELLKKNPVSCYEKDKIISFKFFLNLM